MFIRHSSETDARIVGGYGITEPRPWAALLLKTTTQTICGGFLINRKFVITVHSYLQNRVGSITVTQIITIHKSLTPNNYFLGFDLDLLQRA